MRIFLIPWIVGSRQEGIRRRVVVLHGHVQQICDFFIQRRWEWSRWVDNLTSAAEYPFLFTNHVYKPIEVNCIRCCIWLHRNSPFQIWRWTVFSWSVQSGKWKFCHMAIISAFCLILVLSLGFMKWWRVNVLQWYSNSDNLIGCCWVCPCKSIWFIQCRKQVYCMMWTRKSVTIDVLFSGGYSLCSIYWKISALLIGSKEIWHHSRQA